MDAYSTTTPGRAGRAAAVFASLLALAAQAHADPARTLWSCWLEDDQQLKCVALRSARPDGPRLARAATSQRPAELLRAIRERPDSLRGQAIHIPLYNVPYEDAFVTQLAQAVLCGIQPTCEARYQPELARLIAQSPDDFYDALDPLLTAALD